MFREDFDGFLTSEQVSGSTGCTISSSELDARWLLKKLGEGAISSRSKGQLMLRPAHPRRRVEAILDQFYEVDDMANQISQHLDYSVPPREAGILKTSTTTRKHD